MTVKKGIGILSLLFINLAYGNASQKPAPTPPIDFDEMAYNWSRTFVEVMQITHQKHFKISNPQEGMIKAIDAFLTNLDPHSNFLDPKTYKSILESTSGEFFGIGIIIDNTRQTKDKFLLVIDTIPNGPADTAGVKSLDKIVEIDGKPLEGMTTEEATSMLKGERNTKVHIKIMRDNFPDIISLDIKRDEIKEQASLCFSIPKHAIYYLSLNTFSDGSTQQVEKLLKKIKNKDYKALILDLRNNSGGLLTAAIDIAGLFLDKGSTVVSIKSKGERETERYTTTNKEPLVNNTIPIFILINNYTASAAEILAGCLKVHSEKLAQDAHKKPQKKLMVFLVGMRSFGKGSVQEVIPITNNCAIKITTSLYYLPDDISIQGIGIEPDFTLERRFPPTEQMLWFNKFYGREKALTNYIKSDQHDEKEKHKQDEKNKKNIKEKNWTERAQDMLDKDSQLRETITLINLLHMAQTCCPENVNNRTKAVAFLKNVYLTDETLDLQELTF